MLGLCPLLIVSTNMINALVFSIILTSLLLFTNICVFFFRTIIKENIRIPIYLVIMTFIVTNFNIILSAHIAFYKQFEIFIPLMITNCFIFNNIQHAQKQKSFLISVYNTIKTGISIIFIFFLIGAFREIIGNGSIFNNIDKILSIKLKILYIKLFDSEHAISFFISYPGGLISLGLILALINFLKKFQKKIKNRLIL